MYKIYYRNSLNDKLKNRKVKLSSTARRYIKKYSYVTVDVYNVFSELILTQYYVDGKIVYELFSEVK